MTAPTPELSQRDRLLVAETLERIAARSRKDGSHRCEVYSTPMHARDLLLVADSLRADYDGDDIDLVTTARDEAESWDDGQPWPGAFEVAGEGS